MKKFLGNSIFKAVGWTYDADPTILEKKQVIIGFEHTSNLDAILSIALFQILDLKIHTLIKKELFKGPMKPILEKLGGIPVDRKASKDIVSQMVEKFQSSDTFNLVIAPEQRVPKMDRNANLFVPVFGILLKQQMFQLC